MRLASEVTSRWLKVWVVEACSKGSSIKSRLPKRTLLYHAEYDAQAKSYQAIMPAFQRRELFLSVCTRTGLTMTTFEETVDEVVMALENTADLLRANEKVAQPA